MSAVITPTMTLPVFVKSSSLRDSSLAVRVALNSTSIRQVVLCVLGPKGTNIGQAAEEWAAGEGIAQKSKLYFCQTPEESVDAARKMTRSGALATFWTCAVFVRENHIFFDNPDCLPFFFVKEIILDDMQLATRSDLADSASANSIPTGWRILSHPSPAPLVDSLECTVIDADSNAEAAARCADGEAEACITTETARDLYGLRMIHNFGSPLMVFFGGITSQGLAVLTDAYKKESA